MANSERHEHDITLKRDNSRVTYRLRFSNAGLRAAEDFLGASGEYLARMAGSENMDTRTLTALVWGSTRKNHEMDLPDIASIDDLLDDINDYYTNDDRYGNQIWKGFVMPLMAAYFRRSQKELDDERRRRMGDTTIEANEAPKGKKKSVEAAPESKNQEAQENVA